MRLSVVLAAGLLLAPAPALRAAETGALVPRKVLGLYSRQGIPGEFKDIVFTQLHMHAEMPLNHLGMELVYHEASAPLPEPRSMADYRGIVTWFEKPVNFEDPAPVCRWLDSAMRAGLKLVVLGDPGVYSKGPGGRPRLGPDCERMLRTLGAEVEASRPVDPLGMKVARSEPGIIGFERKLDPADFPVSIPRVTLLPGATAYIGLSLSDEARDRSEPVALTERGALALHPFLLYSNRELSPARYRWIVDPFRFFEAALRLKGLPRPDVTTVNGRRFFFSHVDGDGFFNRSELDPKVWCGQVFLREIVDRYADSPISVSMITGYADLAGFDSPEVWGHVRELLTRPNVEPASHGYAHPQVWTEGKLALTIPGYKMDARREILGSLDDLDRRILPASRATRLFFWTGDCLPSEEQVSLAEKAGVLQMNGEGGRYDSRYASYAYLYPLTRQTGGARQVYAPGANEDSYTNHWTGPYYGYREALETFEWTGRARRVKPVDVYIHIYGAEKYASLQAIRKVLDWERGQPLFPGRASAYIRSVQGFFEMRVRRLGEGRFRFEGGADLRTVRFDGESRSPDLGASKGVLGYKREGDSLYVHLDEGPGRELALSPRPRPLPYLVESNFEVARWARAGGGVRFLRRGWWKGECVLGGLSPRRSYRVRSGKDDLLLKTDAAGLLAVGFRDSEGAGAAREVVVEPVP